MGVDGDGGRGHLGMPEEFLNHVELNAFLDAGDGIAVPKPLRRGLGAREGGFLHHGDDVVIVGFPGPAPEPTLRMPLLDAVDEVEDVQKGLGDRCTERYIC